MILWERRYANLFPTSDKTIKDYRISYCDLSCHVPEGCAHIPTEFFRCKNKYIFWSLYYIFKAIDKIIWLRPWVDRHYSKEG